MIDGPAKLPFSTPQTAEKNTISPKRDALIREKSREFEAAFVSQMLKHSGLTDALSTKSNFGGEAFSAMLTEQYANQIVNQGGLGLADEIYRQLIEYEADYGGK